MVTSLVFLPPLQMSVLPIALLCLAEVAGDFTSPSFVRCYPYAHLAQRNHAHQVGLKCFPGRSFSTAAAQLWGSVLEMEGIKHRSLSCKKFFSIRTGDKFCL